NRPVGGSTRWNPARGSPPWGGTSHDAVTRSLLARRLLVDDHHRGQWAEVGPKIIVGMGVPGHGRYLVPRGTAVARPSIGAVPTRGSGLRTPMGSVVGGRARASSDPVSTKTSLRQTGLAAPRRGRGPAGAQLQCQRGLRH